MYDYKYTDPHRNAMEFGLYYEETVLANTANQIVPSHRIAQELRDEFLIIDPDGNIDDYQGVIGLYNEDTTTDIFGNINGVSSSDVISVSSGISQTDSITIKYYVAPDSFYSQFPDPTFQTSTSINITKEMFQCLLNKMAYTSPKHLFQLGYKKADVLCRMTYDADDSPWSAGTGATVFRTDNPTYYDYIVPHDGYYPFVFTDFRVYTHTEYIRVQPSVDRGGSNSTGYFGELGNAYFDLGNSTTIYKSGQDASNIILDVRIPRTTGYNFQVEGWGVSPYGDPGDLIVIEVSGYYMPSNEGVG